MSFKYERGVGVHLLGIERPDMLRHPLELVQRLAGCEPHTQLFTVM